MLRRQSTPGWLSFRLPPPLPSTHTLASCAWADGPPSPLCLVPSSPSRVTQAVEDCELFTLQRSKFREMLALSVSASLVQRVAWMQATPELVRGRQRGGRAVRGRGGGDFSSGGGWGFWKVPCILSVRNERIDSFANATKPVKFLDLKRV